MCINDTDLVVDVSSSYLLKLADDTKWSMVVETEEQSQVFQEGILRLEAWSREWQMMFNADKCHILHLGSRNVKHDLHLAHHWETVLGAIRPEHCLGSPQL